MSYKDEYREAYLNLFRVCYKYNLGDPFNYSRAKEIYMSTELPGHRVSPTLSGADAYNQNGEPMEYKSTTGKSIRGTYNGISVKSSWPEQEKYLIEEKIGRYSEHYIGKFDKVTGELTELFMVTGDVACDVMIPKIAKKYPTQSEKADPRLGASLTKTEILKYGKRIK